MTKSGHQLMTGKLKCLMDVAYQEANEVRGQ